MLYYLIATLYVLTCLVLLLVVLLQQGKGGDIASAFGGSSSQTAFGARSGATLLSRATTVCAALFMLGALALGVIGQRGPASVVGGVPAPKPRERAGDASRRRAPPAPAPAQPAPRAAGRRMTCAGRQSGRADRRTESSSRSLRKWRNWQTHQLEGLAFARTWGFESPLPHQPTKC